MRGAWDLLVHFSATFCASVIIFKFIFFFFTNSIPAHVIFLLDSALVANNNIEWMMDKLMNERVDKMLPQACIHLFNCKSNSKSKILNNKTLACGHLPGDPV